MAFKRVFALAAVVAALAGGCTDQPSPLATPNTDPAPFLDIIDGHSDPATHSQFFFGAPIRPLRLQPPSTGFNATLRPVVEIYECTIRPDGHGCGALGPLVSKLTMDDPSAIDRLYVLPHLKQYAAIWRTGRVAGLDATKFYRIQVKVGGALLGVADVDIVRTARQLLAVNRTDFVGTFDDFILPITFWIGNGALCTGTCSSQTVTFGSGTPADVTIELTTPLEHFTFYIPSGTTATSGTATVTEVTFTLQTCSGVDVDLPKFGECLRVTTLYGGAGINAALTLSNPATVSMCVLNPVLPFPGQDDLITLHQQDGTLIRALPHAAPKGCTVLTARESESRGLATRGWHWVRDFAGTLFTPRPLFAGSRTAVFNLGGGGQTHALGLPPCPALSSPARIPGMALATCVPAASAPAPLMAPPSPSSGNTISDFQFALPAKINYWDSETDPDRSAPAGTLMLFKVSATDARSTGVRPGYIPDALERVTTGGFVTFTITEGESAPVVVTVPVVGGFAQITRTLAQGSTRVVASGVGFATPTVNGPLGTFDPFWPDYDVPAIAGSTVTLLPATLVFNATGTVIAEPILAYRHSEQYSVGGVEWDRYRLTVTNRSSFPASMFAAAPDLPPCGLNTNSSQSWVDIYNGSTNARIYGFCGLSSPYELNDIWFAVPRWTQPPPSVYITITDRRANVVYTSNTISLFGPLFVNFPRTVELNWSAVASAASYEIEMQYCESWASPDWRTCNLDWKPWTHLMSHTGGTSYIDTFVGDQPGRWRVRANDAAGNPISSFTEYKYFTYITGPGAP